MLTADTTRRAIAYLQMILSKLSDNTENTPSESINSIHESMEMDYQIVHQVPGRIRFRIEKIAQDRAYRRRLERLLKTDEDSINIRINGNAASVVIVYHNINIPVTHWVKLILLADGANLPKNFPAEQAGEQHNDFVDELAVVEASYSDNPNNNSKSIESLALWQSG